MSFGFFSIVDGMKTWNGLQLTVLKSTLNYFHFWWLDKFYICVKFVSISKEFSIF